jgi:hypothetical protein
MWTASGFHAVPAPASKTCLVGFDNNKYAVAASAVGRSVEFTAGRIVIRQDGRIVAGQPQEVGIRSRLAQAVPARMKGDSHRQSSKREFECCVEIAQRFQKHGFLDGRSDGM